MSAIVSLIRESAEDDANLVEGVRHQNRQAIAALFDRYSPVIYSLALRILKDPEAAEDLMQDVFFQVWTESGKAEANVFPFGAWLICVTRNRAADAVRRRSLLESPMNIDEQN